MTTTATGTGRQVFPSELDALPVGSAVLLTHADGHHGLWEQVDAGLWATPGSGALVSSFDLVADAPTVAVVHRCGGWE